MKNYNLNSSDYDEAFYLFSRAGQVVDNVTTKEDKNALSRPDLAQYRQILIYG